jgi:hypothetical protein
MPALREPMRLFVRDIQDHLAGQTVSAVRSLREWICPECDYVEEADSGEE